MPKGGKSILVYIVHTLYLFCAIIIQGVSKKVDKWKIVTKFLIDLLLTTFSLCMCGEGTIPSNETKFVNKRLFLRTGGPFL